MSGRGGPATLSHFWAVGETCQAHRKRTCTMAQDAWLVAGAGQNNRGLTTESSGRWITLVQRRSLTAVRLCGPTLAVEPPLKGQTILLVWRDNAPAQPHGPKSPDLRVLHGKKSHSRLGARQEGYSDGADRRRAEPLLDVTVGPSPPQRELCETLVGKLQQAVATSPRRPMTAGTLRP